MSRPLHVLVVDDDYRVADLHAQFTRSIPGFDVVGMAHTAATAIHQAQALRPDLVLLDQYLPDGRGTDIVGQLGSDVIMLTAAADADAVRAALGHGVLNYLVKPFSPDELGQRLRAYARYREHLHTNRPLGQTDIDKAVTLLRGGDTMQTTTRKGRSQHTAKLVIDLLRSTHDELTASDVAAQLGVSRPTAPRYLADLVEDGLAAVTMRYGTAGRPEHRYHWRTTP